MSIDRESPPWDEEGTPRGVDAAAVAGGVTIADRMIRKESEAAALFETRWTKQMLRFVDSGLYEKLLGQLSLFHNALTMGDDAKIVEHGDAMCRGWSRAIVEMEKSAVADDAYLIGQFGTTTVAVGRQQKMPARVRELHGDSVVWLTMREVAAMFFRIREVEAVKALWPDAEITDIRNKETGEE